MQKKKKRTQFLQIDKQKQKKNVEFMWRGN